MRATRILLPSSLAVLLGAAACGGGGQGPHLEPGNLPTGGNWTGVFYSPQYGRMDMVATGARLVGEFVLEGGERHGRIEGTITGDVLRFHWTERRERVGGRPENVQGGGYFRYIVGQGESGTRMNGDDICPDGTQCLDGEWWLADNDGDRSPWTAQRGRGRPHLTTDSTSGGEGGEGGEGGSSGWDDDSGGGGGESGGGGGDDSGGSGGGESGGGGAEDLEGL